jgi:hypothetical protein
MIVTKVLKRAVGVGRCVEPFDVALVRTRVAWSLEHCDFVSQGIASVPAKGSTMTKAFALKIAIPS